MTQSGSEDVRRKLYRIVQVSEEELAEMRHIPDEVTEAVAAAGYDSDVDPLHHDHNHGIHHDHDHPGHHHHHHAL